MTDQKRPEDSALSRYLQQWLDAHPRTSSALYLAVINARELSDKLRQNWEYNTKPLEHFEPPAILPYWPHTETKAPYWQDLVFGDGRIEKLSDRLDGLPTLNPVQQKHTLSSSIGGLRVVPGHRDLIRYGINDLTIILASDCWAFTLTACRMPTMKDAASHL
jgi:hypothetical protein